MDKIDKTLAKFSPKEKKRAKSIIKALKQGRFENLDIKKLQDRNDVFRVRKGSIRIIYKLVGKVIVIVKLGRRKETTYKI